MHKNMHYKKIIIDIFAVTFREEGVDWNKCFKSGSMKESCHLPWGRCGLKLQQQKKDKNANKVTFREEGVDWNR